MTDDQETHHIARQAAALDDPRLCRDIGGATDAQGEAPARIRVARDADGFWTCREAVSGSPEYVRDDLARPSQAGDERVARLMAALRDISGLDVSHRHNGNRNDLLACEAVRIARAALAAMDTPKGGGDE